MIATCIIILMICWGGCATCSTIRFSKRGNCAPMSLSMIGENRPGLMMICWKSYTQNKTRKKPKDLSIRNFRHCRGLEKKKFSRGVQISRIFIILSFLTVRLQVLKINHI